MTAGDGRRSCGPARNIGTGVQAVSTDFADGEAGAARL